MAGGAFLAMLRVGGFLLLIWGASRVSRLAGISSIVLEITTGLVFSPGIVGLMPKEYAVCYYDLIDDCETQETLNHVQQKLGGCDYDAYMERDGFSFAALPLAPSGAQTLPGDAHGPAPAPPAGHGGTDSHGANATDSHGANATDSHDANATDHGTGTHGTAPAPSADHGTGTHGATPAPAADQGTADQSTADQGTPAPAPDHAADHGADTHDTGAHTPAPGPDHGTDHGTDTGTHSPAPAPPVRRLSAVEEDGDEQGTTPWTGGFERRLSGSSSKGKTRYDSYQECLEKACNLEVSHECTLTPNIFSFVGHIGVALMIFESGMHFDFDKAKECGPIACAIAVLGTFLPLFFGAFGIMLLCGKSFYPEAISAGTALAPTSVGIALKLLNEAKQLQKRHGQIIITAAFVDDILSLVLFNCLFSIGAGDIGFMTFLPAILGITGMVGILAFAATLALPTVEALLLLAPKRPGAKVSPVDELLFIMMMLLVLLLGTAFFFAGTHLWGCFMAGMCFAKLHIAHHVWVKQTKRVTSWMIRIFFSCTVAFSIPIDELISIDAFWKGTIMGIIPCIATKVFCAFFVPKTRWVIGWAMVGRAEFAYLIAQLAASSSMMGPEVFSVVIWSLLYATVFAPFMFRKVLSKFVMSEEKEAYEAIHGTDTWTKEIEADWVKEQKNPDFRQSGHLPDLQEIDDDVKMEEAKTKELSSASLSHKNSDQKVASQYESQAHQDTEALVKKETYAAAPVAQQEMRASKEEHADAATARGSGFLCCLFFRKIVIM